MAYLFNDLFKKWAIHGLFFFIFVFWLQLTVNKYSIQILSMAGFEPRTSGMEATTLPTEPQPMPTLQRSFNDHKLQCVLKLIFRSIWMTLAVWPDWAIYCTLDNFSNPVKTFFAQIDKNFHFSNEIIFGQL